MRHTTFGRGTGMKVSEFALGGGNFGTRWGHGAEPAVARRLLDGFAEAGGNFIDTASSYQFGESEEILGDLLRGRRDEFVLASKFTNGTGPGGSPLALGNSRKAMRIGVEGSLRRMNTDYLDLLWVHFPDTVTPVEEIVRGLDDLVSAGKILHAGFSNFPAWRTARAVTLAELRGWAPLVGVQFEYSLAERTADRDVIPMAEALGLGGALWSPLGGGLLTGKYRDSDEGRLTGLGRVILREDSAHKTAIVDEVLALAKETGATPAQLAVAWVRERARRARTTLVPVIGPRTAEQLESYLSALDVALDDEQYRRLDEVSAVDPGQPHKEIAAQSRVLLGDAHGEFTAPAVPVA